MLLYQILAYAIHRKIIQKSYKIHTKTINLKYQPQRENRFELPDGSYSVSDIQGYFEYALKKHREKTDNLPIKIYGGKI